MIRQFASALAGALCLGALPAAAVEDLTASYDVKLVCAGIDSGAVGKQKVETTLDIVDLGGGQILFDMGAYPSGEGYVIAQTAKPDLGVASLQRELRVSRSRLYRLFEPYGGVKRYIQRRRLLDTHAALADPNDRRRILDIAEERFFSDAAEFSRAFKREFGYRPSDARSSLQSLPFRQQLTGETLADVLHSLG